MQYGSYTDALNRHPAENICHAFDFARHLGCPLNRYVVINFQAEDADIATWMFQHVRDKYRDWHNRKTRQLHGTALLPKYVYTIENPTGQAHVNWVVYVPNELLVEFSRKLPGWVKKATKRTHRPFDLYNEPLTGGYKTLANYIIKGINPLFIDYLHLEEYASPQGRVWGRRACSSASLNKAARKAAGFVPKRDRHKWRAAANVDAAPSAA